MSCGFTCDAVKFDTSDWCTYAKKTQSLYATVPFSNPITISYPYDTEKSEWFHTNETYDVHDVIDGQSGKLMSEDT